MTPEQKRRVVVTVGVSEARILGSYIFRWTETFKKFAGSTCIAWQKTWPPGSPSHREANYAFKAYAMKHAQQKGFTSLLWCDAACYAVAPLNFIWERLERDGHILLDDSNKLGNWSSDKSLKMFDITRDQAMDIQLMVGTCWGLDLRVERSRIFLDRLLALATPENFNGNHQSSLSDMAQPLTEGARYSTDERCLGHRSDEVAMALLARQLGMSTHFGIEFSGGGPVNDLTCIRSGYNL